MDILACFDKNYLMPCSVMMTSVCINNPDENIDFHLIVDKSVAQEEKDVLNRLMESNASDKTYRNIHFYEFDASKLEGFSIGAGHHLTLATYYRLFIASMLPTSVSRLIYLDCDLIVRKSLTDLWNLDLTGRAVAGVPDMSEALPERYERLNYSQDIGYFNAGVLLINLDYWREHNMQRIFFDFMIDNKTKILQHDQDVLNYTCRDIKLTLPLKYNCQDGFYYNRCYFDREKYSNQLDEALMEPVILHYTASKPWEKQCDHPYKEEFIKYQCFTPWKNAPLSTPKHPFTLKQRLVRVLRALHIIAPRYRKLVKQLK